MFKMMHCGSERLSHISKVIQSISGKAKIQPQEDTARAEEPEKKGKVKLLTCVQLSVTRCSLPGFWVHGIFHARLPEWVTISFSRGSSRLGLLYFGQTLYPLSQDTLNRDSSDNETQGLGGEGVLANFFLFERTDLSSCPVASSNLRIVEEEEDLSCFSRIGGVWAPVFGKPPV